MGSSKEERKEITDRSRSLYSLLGSVSVVGAKILTLMAHTRRHLVYPAVSVPPHPIRIDAGAGVRLDLGVGTLETPLYVFKYWLTSGAYLSLD
jgi:hypothetical protein